MSELVFRDDVKVTLIEAMAADTRVVNAARISTSRIDTDACDHERKAGLINYLMKNRHGTPFEHNAFTFRVECPIFVAREFFRHRIASYNEESARYKQLEGVFWVPQSSRPLVQEGKPGRYIMKPGTNEQYINTTASLVRAAEACYKEYEYMLSIGVCREVARGALTVSIYTSFYVTMNARSLMNFLSLRIDDPGSTFVTKPQYEIEQVALQMEEIFARHMPLTYTAFNDNGRVAP